MTATADDVVVSTRPPGTRVLRSMLTTLLGNVGVLGVNLATGVLSARLLEPEGRGTFAAVSVVVVVAAVLGQNGLTDAATYFTARHRERAGSIAATGVVMLLGLAVLASTLATLVVPYVFAAQPQSTVDLARTAVLAVGAVMALELGVGLTAGRQQFTRLAVYRLCQPLLFLAGLVFLAVTGRATAGSALLVFFGSYAMVAAVVLTPLLLGPDRGRPEWSLATALAGYGVRLQGQIIGNVGNTRLDLALLPAFIAAAQIGLYSVAVSVASIIIALFSTLGGVVSPLATTGDRSLAMRLVERTTRVVLVAATVCAVALGVLAPLLVGFAYGAEFVASVDALRLLLPGCVFWGASYLLSGGLRAMGRPGATSIAQLVGLAVTVPGLLLTLPRYGIEGAAGTSSVAYFTVFVVLAVLLGRASPFRARALLDVSELCRDVDWLLRSVGRSVAGGAAAPTTTPGRPAPARAREEHGTMELDGGTTDREAPTGAYRRRVGMPRSTGHRSAWSTGALVIVPALIGAAVSGWFGLGNVEQKHRATGVVQLSEIAGNSPSGQLNPYAADLETTLKSAPVRRQVQQAIGRDAEAGPVEVERLSDASRVSISLEATGVEEARTALTAAGRAGYSALVEQQIQLLEVRERAALARLESLANQITAARAARDAATPAGAAAAASVVQQNERLQSIAVDELSQVQGQLAVAAELRRGIPTTTAVGVDSVEPVSRIPDVVPVFAAGFLGGAIPGAALAALLRRRSRTDETEHRPQRSVADGEGRPPLRVDSPARRPSPTAASRPLHEPATEVAPGEVAASEARAR